MEKCLSRKIYSRKIRITSGNNINKEIVKEELIEELKAINKYVFTLNISEMKQ
jgi:hypothetical protein